MDAELLALLRVHAYFRDACDEALQEFIRDGKVSHHAAGSVVHEANKAVTSVNFVLRGRLKAVRVDDHGTESLFRMLDRGDQFGMMVGILGETVPVRVIALEPSMVISLDYELAMDLTLRYADLRRLWLRTFAGNLKRHFFGTTVRRAPMMLALLHESTATRAAGVQLLNRLVALGENIAIFGDSQGAGSLPGVRFMPLHRDGRMVELDEIRRQAAEWQDANRIIFDVDAGLIPEHEARLLQLADRAVYFVSASGAHAAARRLQSLDVPSRGWKDKINILWVLDNGLPPAVPSLRDYACRDFKMSLTPPKAPLGCSPAAWNGWSMTFAARIGMRWGGAARGMTHLGVLKARSNRTASFRHDRGTAARGHDGRLYASGMDADYSTARFSADLKPSWLFRQMPRGSHWFLLYKYRRGQFDPMLRKYLHNWRLEQLSIPCLTVTADLVGGNSVIRDSGDAVHAILESINLPVLSSPICHDGQALIDGGLVNNIPADVLVTMGCNFVIAVSVTAKMEKQFGEITPEKRARPRRKPGVIQTILRSLLVQNHSLNAIGVQPADVVLADVSGSISPSSRGPRDGCHRRNNHARTESRSPSGVSSTTLPPSASVAASGCRSRPGRIIRSRCCPKAGWQDISRAPVTP